MPEPRMRPLTDLDAATCGRVQGVFCDIDDTLTWKGKLVPGALEALQRLQRAGLRVVPITGRPGAWADHIARMWPVDGVIGENGGLWFAMEGGRLRRWFVQTHEERRAHRARLDQLAQRILAEVPGAGLASDQPYRDLDLAIDFREDVPPLPREQIDRIVVLFEQAGARCKVSSIHVNGWYGDFDKLSGCAGFLRDRWGLDLDEVAHRWLYVGDSPNDEPMFARFPLSVGVANVRDFLDRMQAWPAFVTREPGGHGFVELTRHLLGQRGD